MYKTIFKEIVQKESFFFFAGWLAIAFFSIWGNTSLGMLLLFIHAFYAFLRTFFIKTKEKGKLIAFTSPTGASPIKCPVKRSIKSGNPVYLLMGLFLAWGFLTIPFAADIKTALVAMLGYSLVIYLTFFGAKRLVEYQEFFKRLIVPGFLIGTTIASSYTLIRYFLGERSRGEGIFLGSNGTGTLYIAGAILLIALFDYHHEINNTKKRYLLIIPILLTFGALLVTMSRGAWLGFLAGFALYMLRSWRNMLVFLIIISLLGAVVFLIPSLNERFSSIFSMKNNRLVIWQGTLQMIKDHAVMGIGPGNFPVVYPDYRLPQDIDKNHPYAHNIFLNITVEMGIIGFGLFITVVIFISKWGFILSRANPLFRGLFAAFWGILVHQQFDCTILGLEIAGTFWLIAGLIAALYIRETSK